MRILVVSIHPEGHVQSPLVLANTLASQGHEVAFFVNEAGAERCRKALPSSVQVFTSPDPFDPETMAEKIRFKAEEAGKGVKETIQGITELFVTGFEASMNPPLDSHLSSHPRYDLMVVEVSTSAGVDMAEKHGVPLVVLSAMPLAVLTTFLHRPDLTWDWAYPFQGPGGPGMVLPERMTLLQRYLLNPFLKWLGPKPLEWWAYPVRAQVRARMGLPPRALTFESRPGTSPPHAVVACANPVLEPPLPLPPHWHLVGPIVVDAGKAPPRMPAGDEVGAWLEEAAAAGHTVVYVSTGTVVNLGPKEVGQLCDVIAALPPTTRVLWSLRGPSHHVLPDAVRHAWTAPITSPLSSPDGACASGGAGTAAVSAAAGSDAAAGGTDTTAAAAAPAEPPAGSAASELAGAAGGVRRVVVRSWVAQPAVLAHRAVAAFLTHAGANSVYEALAAGKPMVLTPFGADQYMNAQHVVNKRLGLSVNARTMSAAALTAALSAVTGDGGYLSRAQDACAQLRARGSGLQAAVRVVEQFAAEHCGTQRQAAATVPAGADTAATSA
mmetsp:Transcript_37701/g.95326  ORF Transcript_37701/g.95326 Transcript_37701/m.95326 type:complete len:552 (-) Transcript_37701:3734-5389(-)